MSLKCVNVKKSQIARNQNSLGDWTRPCMMHTHFNDYHYSKHFFFGYRG